MLSPMRRERPAFVGRARDHIVSDPAQTCHLVFPGTRAAVRGALRKAMKFLRAQSFGQDVCGPVELVLAEAINNVIEHAYEAGESGEGQPGQVVEMTLTCDGETIETLILDDGVPMPGEQLPQGRVHDLDSLDLADLPEGGFGWFLIRELTQDLHYSRSGNRNRLSFRISPRDVRARQ